MKKLKVWIWKMRTEADCYNKIAEIIEIRY